MELVFIIIGSVVGIIAIVAYLLNLFVSRVLKNDNKRLAQVLVGLLTLQFILGMLANLFVTIPKVQPYDVWHYVGPVSLHSFNALFLIIFSAIFLIRAIKDKSSRVIGIISLVCILLASYSGITFVLTGQMNIYSFMMSMGFIIVFLLYTWKAFSPSDKKITA